MVSHVMKGSTIMFPIALLKNPTAQILLDHKTEAMGPETMQKPKINISFIKKLTGEIVGVGTYYLQLSRMNKCCEICIGSVLNNIH